MKAAIILAAGKSERMGSPKPLLLLEGKTLLQRAVDNCLAVGVEQIIVVLGACVEPIKDSFEAHSAVQFVINENYQQGQSSSVKIGLSAMTVDTELFWLYPVDCAMVRVSDLQALRKACELAPEHLIYRPHFEQHNGHPILMSMSLAAEIQSLGSDEGLNVICHRHREQSMFVEVLNPFVHWDLDTPVDYVKAITTLSLEN